MAKERNYMFDSFRGLLIWSIPISHFTRVGGHFAAASLSGIVYITINVFVMQAFMFLSGYFSKKPDRARQSAFKTFMLPYLVFTFVFYLFRLFYFGNANLDFLTPPFALWFLFSVFFYRFFLKDIVKIPYALLWFSLLFLVAGQVPFFDDFLALGRTVSYFPFFLIGYYCSSDQLKKLQSLKGWQCAILGIVLIGWSCFLAFRVKVPVGWYLLKTTAAEIGIPWYTDMIMRVMIYIVACLWIILMVNIIPNKKTYLTYVGMNTMPIYIFHLFIRYIIKDYGLPYSNQVIYYVCIFVFASLCVLVFSCPPVAKAYDWVFDKLDAGIMFVWHKIFPPKEAA